MNVIIRCDGSEKIGLGHVVRCLALAEELHAHHRCKVHFAMRDGKIGFERVKASFPILTPPDVDQFVYRDWLQKCIDDVNADILIMDVRDGLGRQSVHLLKTENDIKIVTIDDPEEKRMVADLAFFPPVPQLSDQDWGEFKGKLCIGWEYVILRRMFLHHYPTQDNEIPKILVTMGGTDPYNLTPSVLDILKLIELPFAVTVIIGPGYTKIERLQNHISDLNYECEIVTDPENLAEVMSGMDLAIVAFGQTAYELAALTIPSLYICISEDHERSAGLFEDSGVGINLGIMGRFNEDNIVKKITSLLQTPGKLDTYREKAKGLGLKQSLGKISNLIME